MWLLWTWGCFPPTTSGGGGGIWFDQGSPASSGWNEASFGEDKSVTESGFWSGAFGSAKWFGPE